MRSLTFFLLVALLATVVLSAPAPFKKLNKRTFKVPRVKRANYHRTPQCGRAALLKASRKYGMNLVNTAAATANMTTMMKAGDNENGEVAANPEQNASEFLSPVSIGGQTLNLDFDTGSSDLWVFSTKLPQSSIGQHTAYDPSKSSTFQPLQGATWRIQYGDNSRASGTVGYDAVDIGGSTVDKQAVELATSLSSQFVADTNNDGLVGLAFSRLNTVRPQQQKTFFDNVMPDLAQPLFTADLDDNGGTYEFGTIDTSKFSGDLAWEPVNAASGFWQFSSPFVTVGGQKVQNQRGTPAIADTGTSLLIVDDAIAAAYYAAVPGATNDATIGGYVYPCSATLPDFGVAIGTGYTAVVPGSQITFARADRNRCFGGVQGNGGDRLQIYGDVLFRSQFVVFDGGNERLGFAKKN